MKIKTSDLAGKPLNWAVAKCEGMNIDLIGIKDDDDPNKFWHNANNQAYQFSTCWAFGGPIIEREKLEISPCYWNSDGWHWVAYVLGPCNLEDNFEYRGPTPLIAAMRCYVASKIGDEVEIPDEIVDNL